MVRPGRKAVYGFLLGLVLVATFIYLADWFMADIPGSERPSAWRWFFVGWITATVACSLFVLPSWLSGSIAGSETEEERYQYTRHMTFAGAGLGAISASTGLIGPSIGIGVMAIGAGCLTTLLIYGIALNTTKKGRAMLDKAKANQ